VTTVCSAVSVTSGTSGNNRRRSGGASQSSLEDTSDKSVPDQLALAASRRGSDDRSYPRRGSVVLSRAKKAPSKDYNYGHVELNLVRPEQESHSKLILSTTTAASGPGSGSGSGAGSVNLEDSQTAAEYVANAIKLAYKHPALQHPQKSAPKNPIQNHNHIENPKEMQQLQSSTQGGYNEHRERERERERDRELLEQSHHLASAAASSSSSSPSSPPSPVLVPAPVYENEPVTRSYQLHEASTEGDSHLHSHSQEDIERHYRPKYTSYNYAPYQPPTIYRNLEAEAEEKVRVSASTEIPKSEIMKQIEKSVIKYMRELEAEGKIISTSQELATPPPSPITKTYYKSQNPSSVSSISPLASQISEDKRYGSSTVRPKYTVPPPKHQQQQQQQSSHHQQPPPQQQQQVYHHHHQTQHHQTIHQPLHHQSSGKIRSSSTSNQKPLQHFLSETETAYQAPDLPVDDLSPNVEFIYKIKTRAPLQTATVKTVSKPYTLPLKSMEHFDHGAALKNIEEFDLSHVVPTPDRVERDRERERDQESREERLANSGKPHKLYFNSDIYHDINALPYKSKEAALQEYRHKMKIASGSGELHPDYKGYPGGYFAEPDGDVDSDSKLIFNDQGYPYNYLLKKEPVINNDDHDHWLEQQPIRLVSGHTHQHSHAHQHTNAQGHAQGHVHQHVHMPHGIKHGGSSLEYDSYSPKFNNNPEGYGYQHTYKARGQSGSGGNGGQSGGGAVSGGGGGGGAGGGGGKRGKRGGGVHPRQEAIKKQLRGSEVKDLEASLALRPPPK
ncbi:hypothetical protein KR009_000691, partial [Drosophila setifemur]